MISSASPHARCAHPHGAGACARAAGEADKTGLNCTHQQSNGPCIDRYARGWRKPNPGMLLDAMQSCGQAAAHGGLLQGAGTLDTSKVLMVGDEMEDNAAASNCGVRCVL